MPSPYPQTPPLDSGLLDVGGGDAVYWEVRGDPGGRPAVVVHGGPGAPARGMHRLLDPAVYRTVVIHQRNCGNSTPSAADPTTDLSRNTTAALVADMETGPRAPGHRPLAGVRRAPGARRSASPTRRPTRSG